MRSNPFIFDVKNWCIIQYDSVYPQFLDNSQQRSTQWFSYAGSFREVNVKELNVLIISNHAFNNKMKDDYEYFLRLDLSCLILDNFTFFNFHRFIIRQDKEFLSSVSFLNDSNEAFNQVAELEYVSSILSNHSPQMIITCWRFKHVPTRLPLLYLRFLHDLYQDSRLSRLISDTLPGNRKALLATLSSYFSSLEFTQAILDSQILSISTLFQPLDDCSLSYEVCILCPYTETQIHCLRALQARWNFVFQSDMQNTILSDVVLSVFHELFRLLAHPFLSGASERTICDAASLSWEDCFYRSSTKLAFVCSLIKEV